MLKLILVYFVIIFYTLGVIAEDALQVDINIEDHKFHPAEVEVPAGRKIKLIIHNMDDTIEEFESFDLKREKIVPPHGQINIILAPLAPGDYDFFGDFHHDTARGKIKVK